MLSEFLTFILYHIILVYFQVGHNGTQADLIGQFQGRTDPKLKKNQPGPKNQKLIGVSNPFYIKVESEIPSIIKDFPFNVVFGCPLTQSISISQRGALCTYVTFKQWSRAATTATNDVAVQAHAPKMSPAST